MTNKALEELRELVLKANFPSDDLNSPLKQNIHRAMENPVGLARILIACKYKGFEMNIDCDSCMTFYNQDDYQDVTWNLRKNLENQPPEVHNQLLALLKQQGE